MKTVKEHTKIYRLLSIGAISLFLFLYCGPTNNPEGITEEFLKRLNKFDFESAKEISTDEGIQIVQMISNYYNKFPEEELVDLRKQLANSEIEVVSIEEENDTALVEYKIGESDIEQMELRKVNGKWKANYRKPILEKISVDISQVYTSYNAYGQPDVSFSKNVYPILEYFWNGAFIRYRMANFYIRNIGSEGNCELIISEAKNKQKYTLKANMSYVLRIKPWNLRDYSDDFVTLKMDKLVFESSQKAKPDGGYDIILEELPQEGNLALSNLPDKKWFSNTIWEYKRKYCAKIDSYIKLRSDGLFGYNDIKPEKFKFDGNEKWKIKDGFLYLVWNGGFATVKYKLTNKNTDYLFGVHSNSIGPYMLHRINQ